MDPDKSRLDFTSSEFDALEALTDPDVEVPVPDARVYDNLGQIVSSITRSKTKQSDNEEGQAGPSGSKGLMLPMKRRFLPHQEPIAGRGRGRPLRNVLTRMDEVVAGPMSVLRRCMTDKTRVKVWIRGASWIRGFCVGYVAAFDKQWNLAMTDVDETFTRLRRRKTPVLGPVDHITDALGSLKACDNDDDDDEATRPPGEHDDEQDEQNETAIRKVATEWRASGARSTPPLERRADPLTGLTVRQVRRRHEVCQRHVQQLFIRGEQVAVVAVLPGPQ